MALIPFIAGDSESRLVIGYLFGAGLLVISTLVLVGVVFLYHAHGNSGLLHGRAGSIQVQNFPRLMNAILHGKCVQKNSLLFLTLGILSVVLVTLLFALALPCICLGFFNMTGCIIAGVLVLALAAASFFQR